MEREIERRTYLFYRPDDFLLYVFSLVVVGACAWLAFADAWIRAAFGVALAYMAAVFVMKRGAAFDAASLVAIGKGVVAYPRRVVTKLWALRVTRAPRVVALVIAIGVELALSRTLDADSPLLRPFPYFACFVVVFGIVTVFRTAIFIDHLRKARLVRATLDASNWRRELHGRGTTTHVVHAYITGLICHACALMPALMFWRLTDPTWIREAVLFVALVITVGGAARGLLVRLAMPVTAHNYGVAVLKVSLGLTPDVLAMLYATHAEDHKSRFNFAVFHGHHHDAIPSAVMAAIDTGFVEAIDRSIWLATFCNSSIGLVLINAHQSWFDMVLHQYIPGVYPYSTRVVALQAHHVAHHYGSLLPLGLGGLQSYQTDLDAGYVPDNAKVRWFLDVTKQVETHDDAAYDKFVHLDLPARLRDLALLGFRR